MSVEAAAGWAVKLGWTPFVGLMMYYLKRKHTLEDKRNEEIDKKHKELTDKLDEVFTKEETKELMEIGLKHHSELTDAKFDQLNTQVGSIVDMLKEAIQQNQSNDSKLREDISDIKTSVAVVVNTVENLKDKE